MSGSGKLLYGPDGSPLFRASDGAPLYDGVALTYTSTVRYLSGGTFTQGSDGEYGSLSTAKWISSAGGTFSFVFRIANTGTGALSVSSVAPYAFTNFSSVSFDWTSGTIGPGSYRDVTATVTIPSNPPSWFAGGYLSAYVGKPGSEGFTYVWDPINMRAVVFTWSNHA